MVRRLSAALRWSAAADAAGLGARVEWWSTLQEQSTGPVVLHVRLLPGVAQADVTHRADLLASFYRCARVEVVPNHQRRHLVSVVLHHALVPPTAPYPRSTGSSARLLPPSATEPLPVGLDTRHRLVELPLFDRTSGGTTVLVGGVPGVGKTMTLRVLLAGLAPTTATILVIDPTGGAEAALWRGRLAGVVSSAEAEPTTALLAEVLELIKLRGAVLGAGGRTDMFSPVVLVCDELAELAAAGTPKQQDEARSMLRRVVALGRKANVSVILATQRTTSTNIDVTTRSLAAWRLALAHPDDQYGSEALLGAGRREAASLRKSDVGAAFLTNGGVPVLLRIFHVSAEEVPSLAHVCLGRSLRELTELETSALRELTS